MTPLCAVIAVTYGEFQAWYNCGELRVGAERLDFLEQGTDGLPDPGRPHVALFIERFPHLALEDEEGVLIVQIESTLRERGSDPRVIQLPIDSVRRVIPLTDRARRILEPRMVGIRLEHACLESPVRAAWFHKGVHRAWSGGDGLVGILFEDGLGCINAELRQAVEDGIWSVTIQVSKPD